VKVGDRHPLREIRGHRRSRSNDDEHVILREDEVLGIIGD